MMPKVSIVIPVYNVLEYFVQCMQSVYAQTATDYEIILVDDGSSDGSECKCDQYAETDNRVHVIHKQNGGLASAIKMGVQAASGEFLYFLDGDDELGPFGLEILLAVQREYQADLVCAACTSDRDQVMSPQNSYSVRIICHDDIMKEVLSNGRIGQKKIENSRCGKLFRKACVDRFLAYYTPDVRKGEDQMMTLPMLLTTPQILYIDGLFPYYYRIRASSICQKYTPALWEALCCQHKQITKIVRELSDRDLHVQLNNSLVSSAYVAIASLQKSNLSVFDVCRAIRKILAEKELRLAFQKCCFQESFVHRSLLFLMKHRAAFLLAVLQCRNRAVIRRKRGLSA